MNKILVIGVLSLGLMVGCTNSGSSGSSKKANRLPPASPEATKKLTTAMAGVQNVAEKKSSHSDPQSHLRFSRLLTAKINSEAGSSEIEDKAVEDFSNKLQNLEDNGDCQISMPIDEAPVQNEEGLEVPPNLLFEISGQNCPMTGSAEQKFSQTSDGEFSGTVSMKMQINDPKFQQEADSKYIEYVMFVKGSLKKQSETKLSTNVSMTMTGKSESLSSGPVHMTMTGQMIYNVDFSGMQNGGMNPPGNGGDLGDGLGDVIGGLFGSMDVKIKMSQSYIFSNAQTDLAIDISFGKVNSEKYYVNGQEVSAAEFMKYASELQVPGMEKPVSEDGTHNPPKNEETQPSLCSLYVYDVNTVSKQQIETAAANHTLQSIPALDSVSSCGVKAEKNTVIKGQSVTLGISFYDQVNLGYLMWPGTSLNINIQPEFAEHRVISDATFHVLMQCEPVPVCQ